jgi:ABC-2 type transport system permease protein
MGAIFWRTLKDRYLSTAIYLLSTVGLLWLYVAIFPSIKSSFAALESAMQLYPEALLKAFNVDIASYVTFEGYISSEMFSLFWPLILIFISVGFAGGAISGEIEKGTMELLLSQPVSRLRLFLEKYFAGLVIILLYVGVSVFSLPLLLKAYNIDYNILSYEKMAILGFLFGWAIFSLSMFFSVIFSDKGKVFFISSGVIVAMYVMNILAMLKENLSKLKDYSFFHYFDANNALIHHKIDNLAYWVFLGVVIISTILAALWFSRRDVVV